MELREVAQHIWQVAQRLKVDTGYTGVDNMLAIEAQLSLKIKVKMQAIFTFFRGSEKAGHTVGRRFSVGRA